MSTPINKFEDDWGDKKKFSAQLLGVEFREVSYKQRPTQCEIKGCQERSSHIIFPPAGHGLYICKFHSAIFALTKNAETKIIPLRK